MRKQRTTEHSKKISESNKRWFLENQDKRELENIASQYKNGLSMKQIAANTGKSIGTIFRWLKQCGVETRPRSCGTKGKEWSEARRSHSPKKQNENIPEIYKGLTGREILTLRSIGNKSMSGHGYVTVMTGRREKQYEHILIAENAIGRKLRKGEVVHHINCIRTDNRPENLLVCTIGYHISLHARMRKDPYWRDIAASSKRKQP